jgi:hypothetical protein
MNYTIEVYSKAKTKRKKQLVGRLTDNDNYLFRELVPEVFSNSYEMKKALIAMMTSACDVIRMREALKFDEPLVMPSK